ncbi:D-erythronate dehydrogenase [Telmatospirillum sp. J64-1]|uniref:D-erythronate dehydrogenase n=1 Tax=Telmatospirillum sp. J64-1 TaxID=2502183 RepID=UPI00115C461B|nr:D-erythronate dehydrogenase [Telmatospirillum sp. J64-1]
MNIVVTGGAGFLGSMLIDKLLGESDLGAGKSKIEKITSIDLAEAKSRDPRVVSKVGDISDPEFLAENVALGTDAVFHMAAVVSGQAEAEFETGMRVNIDATRALLDRCRALGNKPRFVFSSSLAVFGGELPAVIPDNFATRPQSSYGMQKAVGELLVSEYSRKGYVSGVSLRLPTVVVRPGKPNAAASSFASGIIREPLSGLASTCPVPADTRLWVSSPDVVVANLAHALDLDQARLTPWPVLNLPGISVTVSEMLEALENVAGAETRALVTEAHDARIAAIVCSWPGDFDVSRALGLGFTRDEDCTSLITQFQKLRSRG